MTEVMSGNPPNTDLKTTDDVFDENICEICYGNCKCDKYKCKECGIKCNPDNHYNSSDYPTLGHIVPLSLKGSHTYANVQCECRNCNTNKSNKILGQQLTLYYGG